MIMGSVTQQICRLWYRNFTVNDQHGRHAYNIQQGHSFLSMIGVEPRWSWEILDHSQRGRSVGTLRKEWSGLIQELTTDADNFSVQLPKEMSSAHKALILSAAFLIDFMFFEDNDPNTQSRKQGRRPQNRGYFNMSMDQY